jgi:hypothetical protein
MAVPKWFIISFIDTRAISIDSKFHTKCENKNKSEYAQHQRSSLDKTIKNTAQHIYLGLPCEVIPTAPTIP